MEDSRICSQNWRIGRERHKAARSEVFGEQRARTWEQGIAIACDQTGQCQGIHTKLGRMILDGRALGDRRRASSGRRCGA
jgi:hypothetical protein